MFLKNRNISSKIKRSKVTDYAAFRKEYDPYEYCLSFNSSFYAYFMMWFSVESDYCSKSGLSIQIPTCYRCEPLIDIFVTEFKTTFCGLIFFFVYTATIAI